MLLFCSVQGSGDWRVGAVRAAVGRHGRPHPVHVRRPRAPTRRDQMGLQGRTTTIPFELCYGY